MTDKERILSHVTGVLLRTCFFKHDSSLYATAKPKPGDLVVASTSVNHNMNDFLVGWYVKPITEGLGGAVIREIGSKRLCNYTNEMFYVVPMDLLNRDMLLEGQQYKTYEKVIKAFDQIQHSYTYRYAGCSFDGALCRVNVRLVWTSGVFAVASFPYGTRSSKQNSVKAITEAIEKAIFEAALEGEVPF